MTLNKIIKIIKQHTWWQEKTAAAMQFVAFPLHGFVEQSRYFHPKYATVAINIFANDMFYEETLESEKHEIYKYIFKKAKKDRQYLLKKKNAGDKNKVFLEIGRQFKISRARLTNQQIWRSYQRFMLNHYIDYVRYNLMPECVDVFSSYYLEDLVSKELSSISEADITNITRTMSLPTHLSFMEHERLLVLDLCLRFYTVIRNNKKIKYQDISNKRLLSKLRLLSRKYYWIKNTYANVKEVTPKDYWQAIIQEVRSVKRSKLKQELDRLKTKTKRLKKEQQSIFKKYKLSDDLQLHFNIVQFMGEWIDDRKRHLLEANHFINMYCQEVAKRFKINLWQVKYYLPEDIKNILLHNNKLNPKEAIARRKLSVYVIEKKGHQAVPTIFYGQPAKKIYQTMMSRFQIDKRKVKGQVASAPVNKITGRVQVILDTHKQKFKSGNVLITTMTRPDFVPYMRRAKAVVTDEGGLICHAAIVARELDIPCVIGTKVATRVFKDGDKVEVDATNGIIRKLKR